MSENYDERRDGPLLFASVPEGRRLDPGTRPKGYGSVGVLRPYNQELGDLLRRSLREIDDADIEQDGKVLRDVRDGSEWVVVSAFVDPVDPAESNVEAFAVRDNMVCFLRPREAVREVKTQHLGENDGEAAVVSQKPPDHDRKLAEIASRKSRFNIPRSSWDERDWRVHLEEARKRALTYGPPLTGEPMYQPKHLAPAWSPLSQPTPDRTRAKAVDMILDRLR